MNTFSTFSIPNSLLQRAQLLFLTTVITLFTLPVAAYQFHSFKLTPKLFNQDHQILPIEFLSQIKNKNELFTGRNVVKLTTEKTSAISLPVEQGHLYNRITNYLTPNYMHIGNTQSSSLLNYNQTYNLGQQNYSGFTWQRPLANFYIGVDRKVEPDLFDDKRWLVKDKFVISINAFTYLSNLSTNGKIKIDKKQLAAFAGMEFVRIYRYTHFADSFTQGMTKEYNKLFLSFLLFRGDKLLKLAPYEFVTKEDYLSANAGGIVQIPTIPITPGVGVNINVGALVEYKKMAQLTLQSLGPKDGGNEGDKLRVSYEVSKEKSVTTQSQLEADFFHLLKLTLLSYELEYNFTDSDKIYLTFNEKNFNQLQGNGPLAQDFRKLLKLKRPQNLSTLAPFITSHERRMRENRSSRYSLLLFGGEREEETQQIVINSAEEQKIFYKNYGRQIKYIRGFFSSLLSSFLRTVFNTNVLKSYKASRVRKLAIEYEYLPEEENRVNKVIIAEDGKLSFNITHQFTARKTKGFFNRKYRKYAAIFTSKFTTLPNSYISAIKNNSLRGPLSIKTVFRVSKKQLDYFHHLSSTQVNNKVKLICSSVSRRSRKKRHCQKAIMKKYAKYHKAWKPNHDMALPRLKKFITVVNKYADSFQDLRYLFGENSFFSGTFKATTSDGRQHLTFFKDGTFQGLGVIDNYRRANITRSPASITH